MDCEKCKKLERVIKENISTHNKDFIELGVTEYKARQSIGVHRLETYKMKLEIVRLKETIANLEKQSVEEGNLRRIKLNEMENIAVEFQEKYSKAEHYKRTAVSMLALAGIDYDKILEELSK